MRYKHIVFDIDGTLIDTEYAVLHSLQNSLCARNAGAAFALAVWGSHSRTTEADYYLEEPADLLSVVERKV